MHDAKKHSGRCGPVFGSGHDRVDPHLRRVCACTPARLLRRGALRHPVSSSHGPGDHEV